MGAVNEVGFLAVALGLAAVLAVFLRRLRLPLAVSYLLSGALLSLFGFSASEAGRFLSFLPEMGLAFLLFLVGMELDLREFRRLGRIVAAAAVAQAALSALFFWLILVKFGFSATGLAALALPFSSTILAVKLLLEEREIASLHGKTAVGILLVEDLLALFVLMIVGLAGRGETLAPGAVIGVVLRGGVLIYLALLSGRKLLPALFRLTAESHELLVLTALGWCLLFVLLSQFFGFSAAVGAFLAGVSLAQSVYRTAISGKIKPLRDFFIMVFFIGVGLSLSWTALPSSLGLAAVLMFYTVLFKPVWFFLLLIFFRFRTHAAFQTGVYLSSVSEFSLIILSAAAAAGLVSRALVSPAVLASVGSFMVSSFLITHRARIYERLKVYLQRLEREEGFVAGFWPERGKPWSNHAVLIGCHRSGLIILKALRRVFGDNVIVVDFNPEIVEELRMGAVACLYGDIADSEIAGKLNLKEAKLVISTVRDLADNFVLLDYLEKMQSGAVVVVTAADSAEAVALYERGAHHVSLPLNLEGASIGRLIADYQQNYHLLSKERERKLGELKRVGNF